MHCPLPAIARHSHCAPSPRLAIARHALLLPAIARHHPFVRSPRCQALSRVAYNQKGTIFGHPSEELDCMNVHRPQPLQQIRPMPSDDKTIQGPVTVLSHTSVILDRCAVLGILGGFMMPGVLSMPRFLANLYAYSQRIPSLSYAVSPDAP